MTACATTATMTATDCVDAATSGGGGGATKTTATAAKRVPCDDEGLSSCGERLRGGMLVSFPTETVYGLGGDALNEEACRRIFAAKERPLSDPLIVHVNRPSQAMSFWSAPPQSLQGRVLQRLCRTFWPGPLTLVARARSNSDDDAGADAVVVPDIVMAGTGFVACRSPSHPVARALIDAAGVPLAAPSANKFGHVSPTTADHVWDDLQYEDVWILEERGQQQQRQQNDADDGDKLQQHRHPNGADNGVVVMDGGGGAVHRRVGVESTVAKVETREREDENNAGGGPPVVQITVLRHGALSGTDLMRCLREAGYTESQVEIVHKEQQPRNKPRRQEQQSQDEEDDIHIPHVAPGQTVRHYSPNIPSYLVSPRCVSSDEDEDELSALRKAVVIDYGRRLERWKARALTYRDLSERGDSSQAARAVFETLRWAERIAGASVILFPDLPSDDDDDALMAAVKDRLSRAASCTVIDRLRDAITN